MTVLDFLNDWYKWARAVRYEGYSSASSFGLLVPGCPVAYPNRYGLCSAVDYFCRQSHASTAECAKIMAALADLMAKDFPHHEAYPFGKEANYGEWEAGANCDARYAWVAKTIAALEAEQA